MDELELFTDPLHVIEVGSEELVSVALIADLVDSCNGLHHLPERPATPVLQGPVSVDTLVEISLSDVKPKGEHSQPGFEDVLFDNVLRSVCNFKFVFTCGISDVLVDDFSEVFVEELLELVERLFEGTLVDLRGQDVVSHHRHHVVQKRVGRHEVAPEGRVDHRLVLVVVHEGERVEDVLAQPQTADAVVAELAHVLEVLVALGLALAQQEVGALDELLLAELGVQQVGLVLDVDHEAHLAELRDVPLVQQVLGDERVVQVRQRV
mmetsp:Transcript_34012/g.39251  ORF Transcript_34012/g.39251 Transcript_34012/m.39251 type:complete len:265 (-) Transcript_34012:2554-3348(-)